MTRDQKDYNVRIDSYSTVIMQIIVFEAYYMLAILMAHYYILFCVI